METKTAAIYLRRSTEDDVIERLIGRRARDGLGTMDTRLGETLKGRMQDNS